MRLCPILCLRLAGLAAGSALVAFFSFTWTAYVDGPNDWPMFRHDLAHTGYNPDETQFKPPLRLVTWAGP